VPAERLLLCGAGLAAEAAGGSLLGGFGLAAGLLRRGCALVLDVRGAADILPRGATRAMGREAILLQATSLRADRP
jgi:hypothetical protein